MIKSFIMFGSIYEMDLPTFHGWAPLDPHEKIEEDHRLVCWKKDAPQHKSYGNPTIGYNVESYVGQTIVHAFQQDTCIKAWWPYKKVKTCLSSKYHAEPLPLP